MCNIEISEMDLRVILSDYVGIPLKYCQTNLETYSKTKILPFVKIDNYSDKYENFYNIFEEISQKDIKLSLKVYEMFYRVVDFVDETKINKFNFFIKQLKDFERVHSLHSISAICSISPPSFNVTTGIPFLVRSPNSGLISDK